MTDHCSRLILLGLDGATFANLRPWAEAGELPNLARIMREGCWGALESTVPPTTPPAWTTAVTGVNPGKHGIFDFRESPNRQHQRPLITGASVRAKKIWHILNDHGLRCGVLNVPITWPPEKLNGFMISGMMTPGAQSDWAEPAELKGELDALTGGYIPDLDIAKFDPFLDRDALAFLRAVEDSFERRRRAFLHLLDTQPWEFFMAVFILPDRIQHLFWKYLDPQYELYHSPQGQRLREPLLRAYQRMDAMLGEVLDRLDARTDLIIMSDHGFGGTEAWFNVNEWLRAQGWLEKNPRGALRKKLFYQAMLLNESPLVRALIPATIQSAIRRRIRAGRDSIRASVETEINWERTQAFFSGVASQGIFLKAEKGLEKDKTVGSTSIPPGWMGFHGPAPSRNLGGSTQNPPFRRDGGTVQEIKQALLALRDPQTGQPVIDAVWLREEIYQGPQTPFAPDLFFKARNYAVVGRALFGDRQTLRSSLATPNGFHRPDGVILALGERFRRGVGAIEGANIQDITPTVLHALGLPVSREMDGRPLADFFAEDYFREHSVEITDDQPPVASKGEPSPPTPSEDEQIRKRLEGLGYLE